MICHKPGLVQLYLSGCRAYSGLDQFLRERVAELPGVGVLMTYCDLETGAGQKMLEGYLQGDSDESRTSKDT